MIRNVAHYCRPVLLALVLFPCAEGRSADMFLETTRSEFQKISLWVMGFGNAAGSGHSRTIEADMAEVLKADLRRTQLFQLVERSPDALDPGKVSCRDKTSIAEAGKSAAAVVTWGRLGRKHGKLILEACARDEDGKDVALSKRYSGSPPTMRLLRRMVHQWADELVRYYTGEPGVAQTRIVYVAGDATGGRALYVMDYDGFGPQRVTTPRHMALMPDWLPDRRSVVYMAYRSLGQEIMQLDLGSKATNTLVPPANLNMTPALSPGGDVVAYASADARSSDIFTVDVRTKQRKQLTRHPGADLSPTWSPDGETLAFVSDRVGGPQIYLMRADGAHVRRLTYEGSYNTAPAWSPRGDWIAYVCYGGAKVGYRLCRITPDGRGRVRITGGSRWAIEDSPSWAPDGRRLIFSSAQNGRSHLYVINLDGTGMEQLTEGGMYHSSPDWSSF